MVAPATGRYVAMLVFEVAGARHKQRHAGAAVHGIFVAKRSFAGPQYCRDQSAGLTIKDHQRQIAGRTVVVVIERRRLLTVGRVLGMIQVENQALWWAGKACNELLDKGLADTVNVLAAGRMLEARYRRPRRQRRVGIERQTGRA